MRMMDELKHMFLYSAAKKVYAPIDEKDKRRNAAVLLLTPNLETSSKLMKLPYVYNPNLINSFYIDRNVMAYIDNVGLENIEDFDEVEEEENLSEALWPSNLKVKIDPDTSFMDARTVNNVYAKRVIDRYAKLLKLNAYGTVKVIVHPNVRSMRDEMPDTIPHKDTLFSYSTDNEIHLVSHTSYSEEIARSDYELYMLKELLVYMINKTNPDINFIFTRCIAEVVSGQYDWRKKRGMLEHETKEEDTIAKMIKALTDRNQYAIIARFLKTGNTNIFTVYGFKTAVQTTKKVLFETPLSYSERQQLPASAFGLPYKRSYPMPDEEHVRLAIKMFNQCDEEDEKELAEAIIKRIKRYGMTDIKLSAVNRFRSYALKSIPDRVSSSSKPKKEDRSIDEASFYQEELSYTDGTPVRNLIVHPIDNQPANKAYDEIKDYDFTDETFGLIVVDNDVSVLGYFITEPILGEFYITEFYVNQDLKNPNVLAKDLFDKAVFGYGVAGFAFKDEERCKVLAKNGYSIKLTSEGRYIMTSEIINDAVKRQDYEDVLKICSELSPEEFKRISFYPTYKNSSHVVKRYVARDYNTSAPMGFIDLYYFESFPEIAQITIAVSPNFRHYGVADSLVDMLLSDENTVAKYQFKYYYWTAAVDNVASQSLARKHDFIDTGKFDKYHRMIFVRPTRYATDKTKDYNYWMDVKDKPTSDDQANITESAFVTNSMALVNMNEADEYSTRLRKYLYKERLRTNKQVLLLYDKIKETNPEIRRTYIKLEMYKRLNVFVDLSYYHSLFLQNNKFKMDRAINFYLDFLTRLINDSEINAMYKKRTIFIPVDAGVWPIQYGTDITDWKKNLNPISIIFRLIRTNPAGLKKAFGNKTIIFVGTRGYFTVDFNKFELKNLARFKSHLKKLMSATEPIEDDEEIDELEKDTVETVDSPTTDKNDKSNDSPKARKAKMIEKIEKTANVKIDNISSELDKPLVEKEPEPEQPKPQPTPKPVNNVSSTPKKPVSLPKASHLKVSKKPVDGGITPDAKVAIISIDPDGVDGAPEAVKINIENLPNLTYCIL